MELMCLTARCWLLKSMPCRDMSDCIIHCLMLGRRCLIRHGTQRERRDLSGGVGRRARSQPRAGGAHQPGLCAGPWCTSLPHLCPKQELLLHQAIWVAEADT